MLILKHIRIKRLVVIKKNAASHLGKKKNKNPHFDLKQ